MKCNSSPLPLASCLLAASGFACALSAQPPFPGSIGTDIGSSLPAGFEGSGATYHARLDRLFLVSDSGWLASMEKDGAFFSQAFVGGDLEGVCVADPESDFVYLGRENPDAVIEYRLSTASVTRVFDVSSILTGSANQGLEAMTFVPDAADPEGGLFHLGQQSNGRVYVFRLPIRSSAVATSWTFVAGYQPIPGLTDLAALEFDPRSGNLLAVFDADDLLVEMTTSGAIVNQWAMPGTDQEGLAIDGCELFATEDVALAVWKYFDFPDPAGCDALSQQRARVSAASGGQVQFVLRAIAPTAPHSGRIVLGSAAGIAPPLVFGAATLPLLPDAYFQLTASNANSGSFVNTLGAFDAAGRSTASLVVPALPPAFVGVSLHHAFLSFHPATHALLAGSNAETLSIVP